VRIRSRFTVRGRRRFVASVLGLIALLAVLAACSGGGEKSSGSTAGGGMGGVAREPAPDVAATNAAAAAASGGPAGKAVDATASGTDRSIVRTAQMAVRVKDVDAAANRVVALADQAGERVDGDQRTSDGKDRSAVLILRVRPAHLNAVLASIGGLGTEVSRNVKGQDVTTTAVDLNARIAALQTSVNRLQQFLSQSTTVPNLIALEKDLSDRQAQLDSLRAQQRALTDQVALASLTVTVTKVDAPVPPPVAKASGPAGFGHAISSGWNGLVTTVRYLLAGVGYALPLTAVALALLVAGYRVWRRRVRPPAPITVPASDSSSP
jgi:hypothetical protein